MTAPSLLCVSAFLRYLGADVDAHCTTAHCQYWVLDTPSRIYGWQTYTYYYHNSLLQQSINVNRLGRPTNTHNVACGVCMLAGRLACGNCHIQRGFACRLLRMTQAVEVLPSLALAPSISMCPDSLYQDLLQLNIAHSEVGPSL